MTFLDARKVTKNFGGLVAVGSVDFVMERGMMRGLKRRAEQPVEAAAREPIAVG